MPQFCADLVHAVTIAEISYTHLLFCIFQKFFSAFLKNTVSFKLFITSVLTPPMPSSSKNPEPLGEDYDTQVSLRAEHSIIFYSLYADSLMVSVLTVIYFEKKLL